MGGKPIYLGVDPGATGGICYVQGICIVKYTLANRTERDVLDFLEGLPDWNISAAIEYINPSIFGADKSACSKLYGSFKALRMALTATKIPFHEVKPSVWQRAVGVSPRPPRMTQSRWKARLRTRAQEIYPREKITLAVSDALLIATYLKQKNNELV